MKKLFSIFIIFCTFQSIAQEIVQFIPQNTKLVLALNTQNYEAKIDMEKIRQSKTFANYESLMKESFIYATPKQAGLSLNPSAYIFIQDLDSLSAVAYLAPIQDLDKFEDFIKNYLKNLPKTASIHKKNGFKYLQNGENFIVWNKKICLDYHLQDDEQDWKESLDNPKEFERQIQERQNIALQEIEKIINRKYTSLKNDDNFQMFLTQKYDVGLWLNLEKIGSNYQLSQLINVPYLSSYLTWVNSFYKNSFWHLYAHFQEGELLVESNFHISESLSEAVKGIYDQKLDSTLFSYIQGNKTMLTGAIAINTQTLAQSFWEIYKAASTDAETSEKLAALIDMLDIIIDEKAIIELLSGDLLFVVNDLKDVDVSYTSYDYDDEYNQIKIQKTKREKRPMFSLVAKIKNKANIEKIIRTLVNFKWAIPENNYYIIKEGRKAMGYLFLNNEIILFCSEEEYLQKALKKVEKIEQISDTLQKKLITYPQFYHLDWIKAMEIAEKHINNPNLKKQNAALKKYLDNIELRFFEPQQKISKAELRIKAQDRTQNILNVLIELLDHVDIQTLNNLDK